MTAITVTAGRKQKQVRVKRSHVKKKKKKIPGRSGGRQSTQALPGVGGVGERNRSDPLDGKETVLAGTKRQWQKGQEAQEE